MELQRTFAFDHTNPRGKFFLYVFLVFQIGDIRQFPFKGGFNTPFHF